MNDIKLSEAQIKQAVNEYFIILKNQGKLWFERLNSGSILAKQGDRVYKIELCEEGTADFIVVKWWHPRGAPNKGETRVYFFEIKTEKGEQSIEQKAFQKIVEAQGCYYGIVRSVEDIMWLEDKYKRGRNGDD